MTNGGNGTANGKAGKSPRTQIPATVLETLKSVGVNLPRILAGVGFLVALALPIIIAAGPGIGQKHATHARWFGYAAAFAAVYAFSVLIWLIHAYAVRIAKRADAASAKTFIAPPGLLVGADNRLSTSKLSAGAWTWVLAWAILSLFAAHWAGNDDGWKKLLKQGIEDQYLILLGGPFLALVAAKGFLTNNLAKGTANKTVADDQNASTLPSRISQAYSDDSGQTDLVDTQYLLFGAVALAVFIGTFLRGPFNQGLPALPDFVIALSSLGATVYIANKWQATDAGPNLKLATPDHEDINALASVTLFGTNLMSVSQQGRPYQYNPNDQILVIFGGVGDVQYTYQDLTTGNLISPLGSASDWIKVVPPRPADDDTAWDNNSLQVQVTFVNVFGTASGTPVLFTYTRAG